MGHVVRSGANAVYARRRGALRACMFKPDQYGKV